ncbi:MAG: YraN family protein [Rhodothalassiaceae bacterium]
MTSRRRDAETWGRRAEAMAAFYLRLKGYRIIGRRIRTPLGEIDLIARRGKVLAIIEVKARKDLEGGLAAIGARQRQRLLRAALFHIARNPALSALSLRFDAMIMRPCRLPRHIAGAFDHDGMSSMRRSGGL